MAVYRETDGEIVREYSLSIGPILRKQTDKALVEIVTTQAYGLAFFLDGQLQLTERDEPIYHEMLVHPCLGLSGFRDSVCILGGGDGCAVREVLKWPGVKRVDLIDWDEQVTDLFTGLYSELNEESLQNPRVTIENRDVRDLKHESRDYGCILIDLVDLDPSDEGQRQILKEVLEVAYRWCVPGGAVVMNLGGISPWETDGVRWAFDQMHETLSWPICLFKVFVPSFGREWVFGLATCQERLAFEEVPSNLTYFCEETWRAATTWSPDYKRALGLNLTPHS